MGSETLKQIITRLRRENLRLAADVEILHQVRSRNLKEIEIAERRLAANHDVIRECEVQLAEEEGHKTE